METLLGIGLFVILVLVYVLLGLGEGGTTCFRCDREEPTGACRACPLRMLASRKEGRRVDAGDGPPPGTGGDGVPPTPERR